MKESNNFIFFYKIFPFLELRHESRNSSSRNTNMLPAPNIQSESNTTAVSLSTGTKGSEIESMPSEASALPMNTISADSDSILPLINETFETSTTGQRGGNAAKDKPFRKNAICSAQHHPETPCTECQIIENDLKRETLQSKESDNNASDNNNSNYLQLMKAQNRSICHTNSNIDKVEKMSKFHFSPITICSTQESEANSLTNNNSVKSAIDSTSFIILHDENDNTTSHFLPNITNISCDQSKNTFSRPCDDCCFCNPNLHSKMQMDSNNSPKKCNFCSSRQQSTPAPSTQNQEKNFTSNNDSNISDRSSTAPTERIFESKYRSTHSHIRTHSKDTDTINTQCTKNFNRKIRKITQIANDDHDNGNASIGKEKFQPKNDEAKECNGNKLNKKKSTIPKLPPPSNHDWNSNSMDTSTSPSSSTSAASSHKSQRRQNSKSVPNLPRAERWSNVETNSNPKVKTRTNSRYQEFYSNNNNNNNDRNIISNEQTLKSKPAGKFHLRLIFFDIAWL